MAQDSQESARLREALKTVQDPEVGINIVDLGLVYRVVAGEGRVEADITLTSAGCPLAAHMAAQARAALQAAAPGREVVLRIVWDPPWQPAMMSEEARRSLGWQ